MSTFRPPQVPQQPQIFFPRGQPLGIPIPRTDYQVQQSAAYRRERPQLEALEQALNVVDYPATAGAKTFVPAQSVPFVFPPPRPSLEALEQALAITDAPLTSGQPLGVPAPRTEHQMAAYFPPHPIATEILSEQLELAYTPGLALGVPNPQQGDQTAAYRRERPSLEALEQAAQLTDQPATTGTPLGVPNPQQSDQTVSLWRARAEFLQPQVFAPISAAPAFVPYAPVSVPAPASWRFEWLIDFLQPEFTPGQPLGTPLPQQSDQSVAYRRERASIEALEQALILGAQQPNVTFVPAPAIQMLAPNQWRFEWIVDFLAPNVTPGQPLGTPNPTQSDQTASYWRARSEILQLPVFAPQGAQPSAVLANPLPMPAAASARFIEALEVVLQTAAPQSQPTTFVPSNPSVAPVSPSWRYEWLILALRPGAVPGSSSAFVPSPGLQTMLSNSYVPALQPRLGIAAILAPAPIVQPFVRGELIPLAPFNGRIAVTFDDRRIVFGTDARGRITVSAEDRRVGLSADDRFILPKPRKPH